MKKSIFIKFWGISAIVLVGCVKSHIGTSKICSETLYYEVYEVNPAGVYGAYLTDSSKFRTYIGTFDPAFQYFKFQCKDDTIYVSKYNRNDSIGDKNGLLIKQEKLRLSVLKSEGKFK